MQRWEGYATMQRATRFWASTGRRWINQELPSCQMLLLLIEAGTLRFAVLMGDNIWRYFSRLMKKKLLVMCAAIGAESPKL